MIRKLICPGDQRLTAGWIVCFAIGAVSDSRIAAADEPVRDPKALIGSAGITPAGPSDDGAFFDHHKSRRLTAEQLLDAIGHLTGVPEATRATQLAVPADKNEFLQAFGQPQRNNTCSCDRPVDGNLGEALALYNGKAVHDRLKKPDNRFRKLLKVNKSDAEIVEELFLAAYCRPPRPEELAVAVKHLAGHKNRELALEDLCWALMTTNEFLSQE